MSSGNKDNKCALFIYSSRILPSKMEATRASVTSGNENYYNMEPTYQTGYTQQEVEGKEILKNYLEAPFFVFHEWETEESC